MSNLKVGVIGLGPMGGNIANNLLKKQFQVVGFDLQPDVTAALEKEGLAPAASPEEVSENSDVVITSLPNAGALDAVINGDDGVLKSSKSGQVLIECSTLTVQQKIDAAEAMKGGGKVLLDSPISATPAMLARGMASIYVSGEEDAYTSVLPVLEGFTASNFYIGEAGNGSRMKILANYLVHVHIGAAAECMTLGQKAGLDPQLIHEVISQSAGSSRMFEIRGKFMADSDYREGGGTMFAVYEKDASIITEFAAEVKAPIDLYVVTRQKMNSAMAQGLGHLDTSAVNKANEMAAGIDRKLVE